ncbi:hypothetical protein RIF29_25633 [Crotalaria pallida]|uniref:Uncharacterized protein n=1 Tax=Crotalaria pallida TaxID=3830 RepID=A0AAN9EMH0_CROPI
MFGHEPTACRKATKKVWIEKGKKPNDETVAKPNEEQVHIRAGLADESDATKEDTTMIPNEDNGHLDPAGKAKEIHRSEKVNYDKAETSMPNPVIELSSQEEGEWTPACTRRKAKLKNTIQKGASAQLVING